MDDDNGDCGDGQFSYQVVSYVMLLYLCYINIVII